jgi:hypothetical protein
MRKSLITAALAALIIVVLLPARAEARHTLAHKVQILQAKVAALQGRVNCLRRVGASSYVGYAWYEGSLVPGQGPYPVHTSAADFLDTFTAAEFGQAAFDPSPPNYWLITLNNTPACRKKFRIVRNPFARPATRTGAIMRMHRLSRIR